MRVRGSESTGGSSTMPWLHRSPAEEIALHIGTSATTVHRVVSMYNRLGPAALETPGRGGRRHQYLTLVEEKAFLFPFFAQPESGEIATVAQTQQAHETNAGHEHPLL